MKRLALLSILALAGCSTAPVYTDVENPRTFTIPENMSVLDATVMGGSYTESATIHGRPAFHNKYGSAVVGSLSGAQIATHVFLNNEGIVCFSASLGDMCTSYKPEVSQVQE